ncbi:MAG: MFS transporter [Actinobacteria bacterium]|nr:MFS transporter [Actinomycetota bacterium]
MTVFGLQQSSTWGWSNPATAACIIIGVVLLIAFVQLELRTRHPLIEVRIFRDRVFRVQNIVLLLTMSVFIPVFLFASEYGQISLGKSATNASLVLLYFFIGFVVAVQIGGRMLDRAGAYRPVVIGSALACVMFALWAGELTTLSMSKQLWYIVFAGAGIGFIIGPSNTAALNRAPSTAYGEATGITQTTRNFGSSLGLAVLGTLLTSHFESHLRTALQKQGDPHADAVRQARSLAQATGGSSGARTGSIPHFFQLAFAQASETVFYTMSGIMGATFIIALVGLPKRTPPPPAGASEDQLGEEPAAV